MYNNCCIFAIFPFYFAIWISSDCGHIYKIYKCSFFCFLPFSKYQIVLIAIKRHNRETLVNFESKSVDIFHKKLDINRYYLLAVYRLGVWYTASTYIASIYTYQQHSCGLHAYSLNTYSIQIHMVVFLQKKNRNVFLKDCRKNNSFSTNLVA